MYHYRDNPNNILKFLHDRHAYILQWEDLNKKVFVIINSLKCIFVLTVLPGKTQCLSLINFINKRARQGFHLSSNGGTNSGIFPRVKDVAINAAITSSLSMSLS